jgi:formylglycine-generating enzyme required for sulfatase activity
MTKIPGGSFQMGAEDEGYPADGEGPVRTVTVDPFYVDTYAVTNAEFYEFVQDTGHETRAERDGWSVVFEGLLSPEQEAAVLRSLPETPWWVAVQGADWLHPEGPGSSIENRLDHPVVNVSWEDAVAYCEWAGKRLPKEAESE